MKPWLSILQRAGEAALQTVFPPTCLCCGTPLFGHVAPVLCADCHGRMAFLGNDACDYCGAGPGPHARLGKGCARCRMHALQFTRAVAVARYSSPQTRELVHALKFAGARRLARPLGRLMADRVRSAKFPGRFDAVVPVPLHAGRLRERGYNQCELLAGPIAEALGAPWETRLLTRVRNTEAQALLPYHRRRRNPQGAFAAHGDLAGAALLLVDDVLTTGSTVSECAGVLRLHGAARVYVVVFGR